MGQFGSLDVCIRFTGDAVNPELVTEKLGIAPEKSHRKGDVALTRSGKRVGPRRTGVWFACSQLPSNASFEEHLRALLALVEPKASAIRDLKDNGYAVEFYCGLFLNHWNQGTTLSNEILSRVAALGADLSLDVYYVSAQEDESPQTSA